MKIFCSFHPKKDRAWRLLTVFLLALAVFAAGSIVENIFAPNDAAASAGVSVPKKQSGKTKDERLDFITGLGWQIDSEEEEAEVTIPKRFDEVYERYNELQLSQGLDLSRYRGRKCMRYTYRVTNFPDGKSGEVRLNLLVYKGKIIGGDVCSLGLDGFQSTLIFPESSLQTDDKKLMRL